MARNLRYMGVVAVLAVLATAAVAQDSGVQRTLLQKADIPLGAPHEGIMGTAEIGPGRSIGRHTHHGVEMAYVLEGEFDVMVDGESTKHVKAGDVFTIPEGKIHDAKNVGPGAGKIMAVWMVEKGKPLAEPAK